MPRVTGTLGKANSHFDPNRVKDCTTTLRRLLIGAVHCYSRHLVSRRDVSAYPDKCLHRYSRHLSGYAETLHCSSIRRVSAVGCVLTRQCLSTLGLMIYDFLKETPKLIDWEKWPNTMATEFSRYNPLDVVLRLCKSQNLQNTST